MCDSFKFIKGTDCNLHTTVLKVVFRDSLLSFIVLSLWVVSSACNAFSRLYYVYALFIGVCFGKWKHTQHHNHWALGPCTWEYFWSQRSRTSFTTVISQTHEPFFMYVCACNMYIACLLLTLAMPNAKQTLSPFVLCSSHWWHLMAVACSNYDPGHLEQIFWVFVCWLM